MFVLPPGANIGQIWASFRLLFCWLPSHESDSGCWWGEERGGGGRMLKMTSVKTGW